MTAVLADESRWSITEPGVVMDMPESVYHRDPVPDGSLSSSGARKLLPPHTPATFLWEQAHPVEYDYFDLGRAAHRLVLGTGAEIEEVQAPDWRSKAAQTRKAEIRAEGKTPLLTHDHVRVKEMAEALLQHETARTLFEVGSGFPEVSLFWQDPPSGIWRRARLDWLPFVSDDTRMVVADYKTAVSANPTKFARSAAELCYHVQASWYLDGVLSLGLSDDAAFVFVVQEKTAPYLVSVIELDAMALRIGRHLSRQAIEVFAECRAKDEWPGYGDDVALVPLPAWYERTFEDVDL